MRYLFFVKFHDPLGHARLDSTDALKTGDPLCQVWRFVAEDAGPFLENSRGFLDSVRHCRVALSAEMNFRAHESNFLCPGDCVFKFVLGECVELVQNVLSEPVSKPASRKPSMHSLTMSSRSFLLDSNKQMSSASIFLFLHPSSSFPNT